MAEYVCYLSSRETAEARITAVQMVWSWESSTQQILCAGEPAGSGQGEVLWSRILAEALNLKRANGELPPRILYGSPKGFYITARLCSLCHHCTP